jgi:isopenicillin N synthase-like dioxygenase
MGYLDPYRLPVIDLTRFDAGDPFRHQLAAQIDRASCRFGSFQIVGHGVDTTLMETLAELNGKLFALGAQAGDEISFGSPASRAYREARARPVRWRGQNAFELPGLREAVQEYLTELTGLGHRLMTLFARGLGLNDGYFVDRYTGKPDTLLRVVAHSPGATQRTAAALRQPVPGKFLTLVMPDGEGGLDVWHQDRRLEVSPLPGALVCHVGRTLERLSSGRYPAARHGLRSTSPRMQLSLIFSFDPDEAERSDAAGASSEIVPLQPLPTPLVDTEEPALEFLPERPAVKIAVQSGSV